MPEQGIPPLAPHIENFSAKVIWKASIYWYLILFWVDNKNWADYNRVATLQRQRRREQDAKIIIKRNCDKIRKLMETRNQAKRRKQIKQELQEKDLSIHPDQVPCSPEIEEIIRNKKIKIEHND